MITIKHPFHLPDIYPLDRIGPLKDLLFFDIETTGFSGDTSQLYLIGCAYYDGFGWKLIQWFADTRQSEVQLLEAFFTFLKRFRILVHFNGDGFDIPYLLKCCKRLGLPYDFHSVISVDIYKKIRPYRKMLGLEHMKQKSIEQFLGIHREDQYTGGQLIEIYHQYLLCGRRELYDLLILHNQEDLTGMPSILPILNYPDLLEGPLTLSSHCLCSPKHETDCPFPFVNLNWDGVALLPVALEYSCPPFYLELHHSQVSCNVSLYQGTLKYYYSDYKDYYYLPFEDTAVHKSIGAYVDKNARKKATAKTCYTKQEGLFLPQPSPLWEPALRQEYKDSLTYVPYQPELFQNPERSRTYIRQILTLMQRGEKTSSAPLNLI